MKLAQKGPIIKNPQFWPIQADIQPILYSHELVILAKFHNDWILIVDVFINSQFLIRFNFMHKTHVHTKIRLCIDPNWIQNVTKDDNYLVNYDSTNFIDLERNSQLV